MKRLIAALTENASWPRFLGCFAVYFVFSWWAFRPGGAWPRALEAGGGILPETLPGFPPLEPQRTLDALAAAGGAGDYLFWQAVDVPYALGNLVIIGFAIALGLKATRLDRSPLRLLLAVPAVYLACEVVENTLVSLFAARLVSPAVPLVLIQQAATTVKLAAGFGSMFVAMAALAVAAVAAAARLFRRR